MMNDVINADLVSPPSSSSTTTSAIGIVIKKKKSKTMTENVIVHTKT